MKKIFILSGLFIAVITVVFIGCSKDIAGRTDNISALAPANIDLNAGTWQPVLLTGPAEFTVPAPIATNTPEYIPQMTERKT